MPGGFFIESLVSAFLYSCIYLSVFGILTIVFHREIGKVATSVFSCIGSGECNTKFIDPSAEVCTFVNQFAEERILFVGCCLGILNKEIYQLVLDVEHPFYRILDGGLHTVAGMEVLIERTCIVIDDTGFLELDVTNDGFVCRVDGRDMHRTAAVDGVNPDDGFIPIVIFF